MKMNASLTSQLVKPLKYYINRVYRRKTVPKTGSIIYSDFGPSGIYIGDNEIVTINNYNTLNESKEVIKITVDEFVRNTKFSDSMYISSDGEGAVKNKKVADTARKYIGEKNNYGLVFKDNDSFIKKCLDYSGENHFDKGEDLEEKLWSETGLMKQKAKNKMGAVKWLLWDSENEHEIFEEFRKIEQKENTKQDTKIKKNENIISVEERESFKNLNIGKTIKKYEEIPLNDEIIIHLQKELNEMIDFFREIQDENLPDSVMKIVIKIIKVLEEVIFSYEQNENSIKGLGGDFSYKELRETGEDFKKIVDEMLRNKNIQDILKKLGKGNLEKGRNNKNKVAKINKDEVFGIHKSSNLSRLLPSELLNLEDDNLKYLFYSKYLENSLLTYEIKGNNVIEKEETEEKINNKGPIVVCLDTSGSMKGSPLIRAKALVFAIIKILREEERELHIIIFGSKDQYQEMTINSEKKITEAIKFLKKGYDGGTDFETPLRRAMEIISFKEKYEKADILMVTDGACKITHTFRRKIREEKKKMKFSVYTVICEADRVEKDFSDRVVVI